MPGVNRVRRIGSFATQIPHALLTTTTSTDLRGQAITPAVIEGRTASRSGAGHRGSQDPAQDDSLPPCGQISSSHVPLICTATTTLNCCISDPHLHCIA